MITLSMGIRKDLGYVVVVLPEEILQFILGGVLRDVSINLQIYNRKFVGPSVTVLAVKLLFLKILKYLGH